jgi:hypothetical protein
MYNRWRKQFLSFFLSFFLLLDLIGRFDHSPTLKISNEEEKEDFDLHSAPWCVGTWRREKAKATREMDRLPTPLKQKYKNYYDYYYYSL